MKVYPCRIADRLCSPSYKAAPPRLIQPVMLLDGKLHIGIGLDVLTEYVEKQYGFSIIRGIEDLAGFTVQLQFVPENVCSIAP